MCIQQYKTNHLQSLNQINYTHINKLITLNQRKNLHLITLD